jgi:hypothetical protein
MKWEAWLEKWEMTSLKMNFAFLQMEWEPKDADKDAAWELYVELLTRISTQALPQKDGDEETALKSIHKLFELTRDILKKYGRGCVGFSKIAVVVLNQVVRKFTAKWHKVSLDKENGFNNPQHCEQFRLELQALQIELKKYTRALATIADVEDLSTLEDI